MDGDVGAGLTDRSGRAIAVLLTAAAIFLACSVERGDVRTPSGEAPEPDTTLIRHVLESFAEAYSSGDTARLRTLVAADVSFSVGGVTGSGLDELARSRAAAEAARDGRLRFEQIEIRMAGRGTAWATCRYALEDGGGAGPGEGPATVILDRLDTGWRVVHIHLSRAASPPTALAH